ncbi:MAG: DMT family transporter [Alphaproteobacteria bacterium]|jgi:drug/metabolite transporter (DMT)-like permease|nr:DMT family transporter [Alphaproteobacteria bacterium]MDP6588886.1 DMT family transporter [Alphaproteobacteria bacterium]MDP6816513.1 DMT family transporter [Alphaproteobacteria bacterium]
MNAPEIIARRSGGLLLSLLLIFVAGINFSFLFSVNKIATEAGVPFFAYVFWYALGAGAVLFMLAAMRGELPRIDKAHLKAYGVAAALGFAFPFALLAFVAPKLPSGVAVLLVILTPAFTYLFSLLARLERLHLMSVGGLVLGIAGVLFIVVPSGSLPAADMAGWFLLALLAPICFAGLNVYVELHRPPETPSLSLSVGILLSAALMLLPLMLATGQLYVFPGPVLDGDLALAGAVVVNILMWPLFYEIVKRTGAFLMSMINVVGVVAGILWSMVFFGERHSGFIWLAGGLMLIGLGLILARPILAARARSN